MLLTRNSLSPLEALVQRLGIVKPVANQLVVLDQVRYADVVPPLATRVIEGNGQRTTLIIGLLQDIHELQPTAKIEGYLFTHTQILMPKETYQSLNPSTTPPLLF